MTLGTISQQLHCMTTFPSKSPMILSEMHYLIILLVIPGFLCRSCRAYLHGTCITFTCTLIKASTLNELPFISLYINIYDIVFIRSLDLQVSCLKLEFQGLGLEFGVSLQELLAFISLVWMHRTKNKDVLKKCYLKIRSPYTCITLVE